MIGGEADHLTPPVPGAPDEQSVRRALHITGRLSSWPVSAWPLSCGPLSSAPLNSGLHARGHGSAQPREPILEDDDVVSGRRDLGAETWPGRAERTRVDGGQEGAVLPRRGVPDPLAKQRVQPQLAVCSTGLRARTA